MRNVHIDNMAYEAGQENRDLLVWAFILALYIYFTILK